MSSFSDLPPELTTDILDAAISQHPNPGHILAVNRCFNDIGQLIIYTSLRFKTESQLVRFALKRRFCSHHNRGHNIHHNRHHHHYRHKHEHQGGNGAPAIASSAMFPTGSFTVYHNGPSDTVAKKPLPHTPRSITVRIPGGQGSGLVFEGIKHVFEFCAEAVGTGVLALDSLELCLHSLTSDPAPWKIGEALSLVKYVPYSLSRVYGTRELIQSLALSCFASPRKFVWTGPDPPHHFSTAVSPPCAHVVVTLDSDKT